MVNWSCHVNMQPTPRIVKTQMSPCEYTLNMAVLRDSWLSNGPSKNKVGKRQRMQKDANYDV